MTDYLKAFFEDKAAQKAWAEFILEELNEEALRRVYKGKDTAAVKEAHDIISASFKKLAALYTPKKKQNPTERNV
jgi:archaellum component FlaC